MVESKTEAPPLRKGPMTPKVLQGIFASDQDMYPAPLTRERLDSWAAAAPEMASCFYLADSPETVVGAVIALPLLATSWHDLLVGKIKETDVDPETMFPGHLDEGSTVGLHVFHVERFQVPEARGVRGFADVSMRAVVDAAEEKGWKVVGHSALTATPEGRRCFEKMGFAPTGYEEFWVTSESSPAEVHLVTTSAGAAPESLIPAGSTVKGHARMLARHL
ncbi:hypothetical protein CSOJ01_08686 [Colletotrichum sojae]|uniref:N-acetyltransferase domain-containing protein n=1 Tax=Colletotrichum sojae TaxID=2175907 RepID=A0A8H6MRR0_9PEZI|nr:hypothetical protein CSOJ01_08686 [Colletotrichum sojae]